MLTCVEMARVNAETRDLVTAIQIGAKYTDDRNEVTMFI
jgi:hypothetical protein